MGKMTIPAEPKKYRAAYYNLSGVDFSTDMRSVDPRRALSGVNMYKAYADGYTEYVETRPGITGLFDSAAGAVHGIYRLKVGQTVHYVAHIMNRLYTTTEAQTAHEWTQLYEGIADRRAAVVVYDEKLYIADGEHYLVYDGTTVSAVTGTVPLTSVARTPGGAGTVLQAPNMLTPLRRNSFRADGLATVYYLDAPELTDAAVTVTVDGVTVSSFTVDRQAGTVTFPTAPAAPAGGDDNVIITFGVPAENKAADVTLMILFDNRVFFAGSSAYPNVMWHSEVNDPAYIPDVNYYKDGDSNSAITGLVVQDGSLLVFKNSEDGALFVHTPATDYELGRIYPAEESVIRVPCVGAAVSFRDDVVYLSRTGVEGITYPNITKTERIVRHRSTLIDRKLKQMDFSKVSVAEWNGYLCLLFGDEMFLADSRGRYSSDGAFEYEWFYWTDMNLPPRTAADLPGSGTVIAEFDGVLYLGTSDGRISKFDGYRDSSGDIIRPIYSEWVTRAETGGTMTHVKTVKEKGAMLAMKKIENSSFSVAVETDSEPEETIREIRAAGLTFGPEFSFVSFSFTQEVETVQLLPLARKKWQWLKLKIYSESGRFGCAGAEYEYTVGNYLK